MGSRENIILRLSLDVWEVGILSLGWNGEVEEAALFYEVCSWMPECRMFTDVAPPVDEKGFVPMVTCLRLPVDC